MSPHAVTVGVRRFPRQQYHPELLNVGTVTPTTEFPVTLAEAREWLRVDGTDQDTTIDGLIAAMTSWAEGVTRRAFITRDLDVTFAEFAPIGRDIVLPFPIVTALTGVTYTDSEGLPQVFDITDLTTEPLYGRVRVNEDAAEDWPQAVFDANFLYTCGFGAAADVPEQIKTAIKVGIDQLFELRKDQPVGSQVSTPQVKSSFMLLQNFRVREF